MREVLVDVDDFVIFVEFYGNEEFIEVISKVVILFSKMCDILFK